MKIGLFIFPVRFASMPPIDIAYLSAYLKKRGHEVYIRDFNVEIRVENDCDTRFWSQLINQQDLFNKNKVMIEKWVEDILAFSPDYIGISVWETELYFSQEIAKMIKNRRKDTKIIFGGPWCSFSSGRNMIQNEYVDYAVFGEGEFTLAEIIESQGSQNPIPGCLMKVDGKILDGGWREETINPDLFPYPDYSSFDFNKYLYTSTYPILFNRGCNWNCSFCTHRTAWHNFRSRSAENIFAEIQHCFSTYPWIKRFYSCDHSINSNMKQVLEVCDFIITHGVQIEAFIGFGQVNPQMLKEDVIKKLKQADFKEWGIGVQTGSDRILKSMRRPYTAAQAEQMLEIMHKYDIRPAIDFIIGYPEETEDDFRKTLEFISRICKYVTNISVAPSCYIGNNDLWFHPERYGICALKGGGESWESPTSTPAIRLKRYQIMMAHLSHLGISHRYSDEDRKFAEDKMNS